MKVSFLKISVEKVTNLTDCITDCYEECNDYNIYNCEKKFNESMIDVMTGLQKKSGNLNQKNCHEIFSVFY